jgi:DNA-binding beta-propeller fold protein YncE
MTQQTAVGLFPETLALTPDGRYLFVTNSDAPAARMPSNISIVFTPTMTEVARPATCVGPHGGRVDDAGLSHYSVCASSDQLVQIDTRSFHVTRRLALTPGQERILGAESRGADLRAAGRTEPRCTPQWVEPGRGTKSGMLYVACDAARDIIEIDASTMQVRRRIPMTVSPDRMSIDPSGHTLFVADARDTLVSAVDVETGTARATIATSDGGEHHMAFTPDGRFLFVSNAGTSNHRGSVDIIDVASMKRTYTVETGYGTAAIGVSQTGHRAR